MNSERLDQQKLKVSGDNVVETIVDDAETILKGDLGATITFVGEAPSVIGGTLRGGIKGLSEGSKVGGLGGAAIGLLGGLTGSLTTGIQKITPPIFDNFFLGKKIISNII